MQNNFNIYIFATERVLHHNKTNTNLIVAQTKMVILNDTFR